ncbi:MAG: helix-turn-helix domain-containing protein [Candidatus Limnocylindrales bacterium]
MSTGIAVPYLARALAIRGLTMSEFAQRSGCSRNTLSTAMRGGPITARTFRRVVAALDLVPVSATAHELGAGVGEAPARVGGPGRS